MSTPLDLTKKKTVLVRMGWDAQGEKHPKFLEEWKNATLKTRAVLRAHFEKYPDAGVALVTGEEANLTVLDFDTKNNPLFSQLFQACPTYWVTTRKGFHLYYTYEQSLLQGTDRFGKGVDVRNDGGLVFCPPTKNYVGRGETIATLNDEAKDILEKAVSVKKKTLSEAALKRTETRNDSLFRKACAWINAYPKEEVFAKMVKANRTFHKGELSDEELETIYQQAVKYQKETEANALDDLGLLFVQKGDAKVYSVVTENIYRLLQNHPEFQGRFRYDEWTQRAETLKNGLWEALSDFDIVPIQRRISTLYAQFRGVKKDMVNDAVLDACRANSFDRAKDWLRSLTWDKEVRLEGWLTEVYGCPNDSYHNAVGANWLKGIAKRLIEPGCQFDSVLIIKGRQGCGKSSSLSLLGGDWYAETTMRADNKDFFLQLRGKMIVEFAEGETLSKTETKQMKAIISARFDTYRPPYGRMVGDFPRRCVFAMTTNQERPLKDETGNRRFFPIEVALPMANLKWLKDYRDQLFAEALYRVETLKETVYEYPDGLEAIQEQSVEESPYEDDIRRWMGTGCSGINDVDTAGVTVSDVWYYGLNGDRARIDRRIQMNIAAGLKACGFEKRRMMINGEQRKRWFPNTPIKPWREDEDRGGQILAEGGQDVGKVGKVGKSFFGYD